MLYITVMLMQSKLGMVSFCMCASIIKISDLNVYVCMCILCGSV